MTFAERLRELRVNAGLTQAALAGATGLSIGAIRNYEQGIREPYWTAVFKLADALGVSSEAFRECIDAAAPGQPGRPRKPAPEPSGGEAGSEAGEEEGVSELREVAIHVEARPCGYRRAGTGRGNSTSAATTWAGGCG
jgi:transcriptional regulator with XRE-family HTH domain